MELGAGERTEPADPKERELQADSRQMRNSRLNCQQFPMWNLGTQPKAEVFQSNGKLWTEPKARVLGSAWDHLLTHADLPCTAKPVRSGA